MVETYYLANYFLRLVVQYMLFTLDQENQGQPFISKHFNVINPLRINNNLGRSVSKGYASACVIFMDWAKLAPNKTENQATATTITSTELEATVLSHNESPETNNITEKN